MQSKELKITIITPSFNQGKFIGQTIQSVLDQNCSNLEYIVIDGGSTDNTLSILKKYSTRIKWISEKDSGQMEALNKGLKMAHGDIIAFINSDDYYLPETLNKIVKYFKEDTNLEVITGDYIIIDSQGKEIQTAVSVWKKILRKFHGFNTLCVANYINQPSTFWRKSVIDKIGYFNEELHYVFDYEYWLRILRAGITISIVREKFSCYRIHSQSKGGSQYKKRSIEELAVQKKYNTNPIIYGLHILHNQLMVFIYNFIQ